MSHPPRLSKTFPPGGVFDLTRLDMGLSMTAHIPESDVAFDGRGYPAIPRPESNSPWAPERELSRWLFGWDDNVPPARMWMTPRADEDEGDPAPNHEMIVVATGEFAVLLTDKALRVSLYDGELIDNGRVAKRRRIYSFVLPLERVDYLEQDKRTSAIRVVEPATMFESIAVFPATDSWGARLGWRLHHQTSAFNVAIAQAVGAVQAASPDAARAARARAVMTASERASGKSDADYWFAEPPPHARATQPMPATPPTTNTAAPSRNQHRPAEAAPAPHDWLRPTQKAEAPLAPDDPCPRCGAVANEGGWCGLCGLDLVAEATYPRMSRAAVEREDRWKLNPEDARARYGQAQAAKEQ